MSLIRGLDLLIADLDSRARPGNPSKNRPLQAIVAEVDNLGVGQDTQTNTLFTPPFQWFSSTSATLAAGGNPSSEIQWGYGEWS